MLWRGSKVSNGFWKTICVLRRNASRSAWYSVSISRPLSEMRPAEQRSSRTSSRPSVLLPQPDSPITPRTSPGPSVKLTPSTALTTAFLMTVPSLQTCFFFCG